MSAYNVLGCKSHDGGGGGGDCCECSLTLELDPPRTYTGPGSMGGQWHWDVTTSLSPSVTYDGTLGRVSINVPGTYHLESTLVAQVESGNAPWDYITIQGYQPPLVGPQPSPLQLIFNNHLFSAGGESISNCTSTRTLVVPAASVPYHIEFFVIMRDVPSGDTLFIFPWLTNFRIKKICDETPTPVINDPPGFPLPPYDGTGTPI